MKKTKLVLLITALTFVALMSFASEASAANPAYTVPEGTATVDGNPNTDGNEWDSAVQIPMYIAGIDNTNHPIASYAYLLYDSYTETLYIKITTTSVIGVTALTGASYAADAWMTVGTSNTKLYTGATDNNGVPPDFAWLTDGTGYEASVHIARNHEYTVQFHLEVHLTDSTTEASTSATLRTGIDIFLLPETLIGTTIVGVFAALVAFAVVKNYRKKPQ